MINEGQYQSVYNCALQLRCSFDIHQTYIVDYASNLLYMLQITSKKDHENGVFASMSNNSLFPTTIPDDKPSES